MQAASPARKIIPTFMIRKKHCNFLDIKQISSKVHNFRPQAGKTEDTVSTLLTNNTTALQLQIRIQLLKQSQASFQNLLIHLIKSPGIPRIFNISCIPCKAAQLAHLSKQIIPDDPV